MDDTSKNFKFSCWLVFDHFEGFQEFSRKDLAHLSKSDGSGMHNRFGMHVTIGTMKLPKMGAHGSRPWFQRMEQLSSYLNAKNAEMIARFTPLLSRELNIKRFEPGESHPGSGWGFDGNVICQYHFTSAIKAFCMKLCAAVLDNTLSSGSGREVTYKSKTHPHTNITYASLQSLYGPELYDRYIQVLNGQRRFARVVGFKVSRYLLEEPPYYLSDSLFEYRATSPRAMSASIYPPLSPSAWPALSSASTKDPAFPNQTIPQTSWSPLSSSFQPPSFQSSLRDLPSSLQSLSSKDLVSYEIFSHIIFQDDRHDHEAANIDKSNDDNIQTIINRIITENFDHPDDLNNRRNYEIDNQEVDAHQNQHDILDDNTKNHSNLHDHRSCEDKHHDHDDEDPQHLNQNDSDFNHDHLKHRFAQDAHQRAQDHTGFNVLLYNL